MNLREDKGWSYGAQSLLIDAAGRILQPDRMIWVVVGDRARIEESIRALGLGEIRFLDADGYLITE